MIQQSAPPSSDLSTLPRQLTPLMGRVAEVTQIRQQLLDPACRLLTVLGPGGMGKTRLAIEVATALQDEFTAGAYFVNLQPINDLAQIASAIAEALNLTLAGSDTVENQLQRWLANKELLLVLDNFEQLSEGVDMLSELLAAAGGVKLLVTSRQVLNLQEEWLFPLAGLPTPPATVDPRMIESYAAATLFIERARRVRPHLVLSEETEAIGRICRLVEGMPLALELAATWSKTLSCAEIASEIEHGITFLSSTIRNAPERHRSMSAVFEQSWQQLTASAQAVFARLSVFQGSFDRVAAERVAAASLATLSLLVDKSLLRWKHGQGMTGGGRGRYHIHEMLRQFAAEQLTKQTTDAEQTHQLHAHFYLGYLTERLPDILSRRQLEACTEIESELSNIRAAWLWATQHHQAEMLAQSAATLSQFFQIRSRFQEGADLFAQTVEALNLHPVAGQREPVLITLRALLGWFYIRLGRLEEAATTLQQGEELMRQLGMDPISGVCTDPRVGLGILALVQGDYTPASQLARQALTINLPLTHWGNCQLCYDILALASFHQGKYEAARHHAEQIYKICQSTNEHWYLGHCLNRLGNVAYALEEIARARSYYEASYQAFNEFNDAEGMSITLKFLGQVALRQGNYQEAHQHYQASLLTYQRIGDQGGLANTLNGLARAATGQGDYVGAQHYLRQSLQITTKHGFTPISRTLVLTFGEWLIQTNQRKRGLGLINYIFNHPTSEIAVQNEAQWLLEHHATGHTLDAETSWQQGKENIDFDALVSDLMTELAIPVTHPSSGTQSQQQVIPSSPTPTASTIAAQQPLIEPLTERELEILQLVANGSTNQEIANKLYLAVGTVKWYCSEIYGKLGVASRTQAVAETRRLKLIE